MKPYLHCRNHRHAGGITCDNTKLIRYEVLEEIHPISARMIVNRVSMNMESKRINNLIKDIKEVLNDKNGAI